MNTDRDYWPLVLAAAAILMLLMGARQSLGLFIAPLDAATGIGVAGISLAFAVSQFVWGAAQPLCGALADRYGTRAVICGGALLTALGTAAIPFAHSTPMLVLYLGVIAAAGAAGGSFAVLIGGIARYLPEERRSFAAGFINAGSSFGQFVFAPLAQLLIMATGWVTALFALAASALLVIPLATALATRTASVADSQPAAATGIALGPQDRADVLSVRGGPGPDLARYRAADCRTGRQAVRHASPRDTVRLDPAVTSDRRVLRRLARWPDHRPLRRLQLDVVRGYRACGARSTAAFADPRGTSGAAGGRRLGGSLGVSARIWHRCLMPLRQSHSARALQ